MRFLARRAKYPNCSSGFKIPQEYQDFWPKSAKFFHDCWIRCGRVVLGMEDIRFFRWILCWMTWTTGTKVKSMLDQSTNERLYEGDDADIDGCSCFLNVNLNLESVSDRKKLFRGPFITIFHHYFGWYVLPFFNWTKPRMIYQFLSTAISRCLSLVPKKLTYPGAPEV